MTKVAQPKKGGFYARLPLAQIADLRRDATANGKTLDGVTSAIIGQHFAFKAEERKKLYVNLPPKSRGRRMPA